MEQILDLIKFKNRYKPLEFAWSWEPEKFYRIAYADLERIFYLLSIHEGEEVLTANIKVSK